MSPQTRGFILFLTPTNMNPEIISLAKFRPIAREYCFGENFDHLSPGSYPKPIRTENSLEFRGFVSCFSGERLLTEIDLCEPNIADTEIFLSIWPDKVRVCFAGH